MGTVSPQKKGEYSRITQRIIYQYPPKKRGSTVESPKE